MSDFATLQDVLDLSGASYTADQQARIQDLLPLVSDALRYEADKVGKDLDVLVTNNAALASVAKLVTVDVVVRVLRQSTDGEPMSQESQSALGYSWSGTYAIPGGGISNAIMRNDLKRLGLWGQKYGVIDFYGGDPHEQV
jgi:hypothetical protein